MKIIFLIMTSLFLSVAQAQVKVAVIDTGLNLKYTYPLCGIKDFTNTSFEDTHGHGTNISGIIHKEAKGADYCQVVLKFFDKKSKVGNQYAVVKALEHAISQKVDIINFSLGGEEPNPAEKELIIKALNKGIIIVAAAGNDAKNECSYFPACYDKRIVVVGAMGKERKLLESSNNSSSVDLYADGDSVTADGITQSGTSQATAKVTGVLARALAIRGKK